MIPMVDLIRQYKIIQEEINGAIRDVLNNGQFILGPEVAQLEREVAAYCHSRFACGLASGTDALLLALRACNIGPGDEVITTAFTFAATAEAISYVQARPVFIDISPDTYNMAPECIQEKISSRTRAIIPVHLYGHPVDMEPLLAVARQHNLLVIEDCAQAFGARYGGKEVGTFGICGCFSFFPSKNLGGYGDGGMIITDDEEVAKKIGILRNHGSKQRYEHECVGYNSRLDEMQAAVLRVKLKRIDEFNASRRRHAALYSAHIEQHDVILPAERAHCHHVYHQYTVRSPLRDRIKAALAERDIASAIYYPLPLHRQRAFFDQNPSPQLPKCEQMADEVLSLPMFPELTEEEVLTICRVINDVC